MPKKALKPVEAKEGATLEDALNDIIEDINPKDEAFVVSKLNDPRSLCVVKEWISSGCLPVDLCFGGGFPVGRLTEVYGDNATGKSLLAAQAVVQAQKKGYLAVFADAESAISLDLMKSIGVDVDKLVYFAPDTINQVFSTLNSVIDSKNARVGASVPMLFVWDSVAASSTKEEREDQQDLDQKHYASGAPQISRAFRTGIEKKMAQSNVCAIFINQIRANVGAMFGEKDVTYGGKAIPFYASIRVQLKNIEHIKAPERKHKMLGVRISLETKKNKIVAPYRYVEVPIYYGTGLDDPEATLDLLKEMGIVEYSAPWHTLVLGGEIYKFKKTDWLFREEQGTGLFDELYEPVKALLEQEYPKWA